MFPWTIHVKWNNLAMPRRKPDPNRPCPRCGTGRPRQGQSYCRRCHAAYQRASRRPHGALSEDQRRRAVARSYANVYQSRGKLTPQPCLVCGTDDEVEKHHEDYSRPLQVMWLCRKHHLMLHRLRIVEDGRPSDGEAIASLARQLSGGPSVSES